MEGGISEVGSSNHEIKTPKVETGRSVGEKVTSLLSFLKKREVNDNPDLGFQAIVDLPDGQVSEGSNASSENQDILPNTNKLLQGFNKAQYIFSNIAEHDLAGPAIIAGLGFVSALAGGPSELAMGMEIGSIAVSSGGGSAKDKMKGLVTGAVGFAASQGIDNLPLGGIENAADMALGSIDVGKNLIKEALSNKISSTVINTGRNRMTRKPKLGS